MKLSQALKQYDLIVENGPLGTRLKYDYGYNASYDLSQDIKGRQILVELYKGDMDVALQRNVPIIINAATFRASCNHISSIGINDFEKVSQINLNNIQIIIELRDEIKDEQLIFLGAPLGSMFDAYSIENTTSSMEAYEYHKEQIGVFKKTSIDFINVVTLPTVSEALGIAQACDESGFEYTIGFILGSNGRLLDGTSLDEAIEEIDGKTQNKPLGYLVTCTHPSVISLLDCDSKNINRLIGVQANGSCLTPSELEKFNKPVADEREEFAIGLKEIKEKLGLKIIAGCCGTTKEHLCDIIRVCQS